MSTRVNIHELLKFYDADSSVRKHSAAIKAVGGEELCLALLAKYFELEHRDPEILAPSCVIEGGGNWLDAWVKTTEDGHTIHNQVEVKAWSFHGYNGGDALEVDPTPDGLQKFLTRTFNRYWDPEKKQFRFDAINKVLKRAIPVPLHDGEIRAIACLWAPMHPAGERTPFFKLSTAGHIGGFSDVWIFSASLFLRNLRVLTSHVELDLPKTRARLDHLNRIYG